MKSKRSLALAWNTAKWWSIMHFPSPLRRCSIKTPATLHSPNTRSWYSMYVWDFNRFYKYIILPDTFWICRLKSESMVQVRDAFDCLMIDEKRCSNWTKNILILHDSYQIEDSSWTSFGCRWVKGLCSVLGLNSFCASNQALKLRPFCLFGTSKQAIFHF